MVIKNILIMLIILFSAVYAPASQDGEIEFLSDSINAINSIAYGRKTVIAGFYFDPGSSSVNASLQDYLKKFADEIKKLNIVRSLLKRIPITAGMSK
ncbi:MAG: hypothetical protein LBD46_00475 [Endomicrobium sp.]|jgi:outer membrane protein OmpA-like peptidoglycan-associated protein|nr:hypothetical protein [Endomicrobium sp.]